MCCFFHDIILIIKHKITDFKTQLKRLIKFTLEDINCLIEK